MSTAIYRSRLKKESVQGCYFLTTQLLEKLVLSMPPRYSRPKAASEHLVPIEGQIEEILEPKQLEDFASFAIVRLSGRLVKGNFPFLDLNFTYRFKCYCQKAKFGDGAEYIINQPDNPPFLPLPLNAIRLKEILRRFLNVTENTAEAMVAELSFNSQLAGVDFSNFTPDILINRLKPTPDWLERLTQESFYFRYPFIQFLQKFWSPMELSNYTVPQLLEIGREFNENPENFAYEWRNRYRLPELGIDKVEGAMRILNLPIPPDLKIRHMVYNHCRQLSEKRGLICYTEEQVRSTNLPCQPAIKGKILQPIRITVRPGVEEFRYFLAPAWRTVARVREGLRRLMSTPLPEDMWLKNPRKVGFPGSRLTEKQHRIVQLSKYCPVMFIDAPGGVGKTFTALRSAALSRRKIVLACAHYGRVASMLRKTPGWGSGVTIHRLVHLIEKGTKVGQRLQETVTRIFIDEGSHLNWWLLGKIFELFPKMRQLFILGDGAQMRPPSGAPVYEALIEFYKNTPYVQTLNENMRVDQENADQAAALLANNLKIREGRSDLTFTRHLEPNAALILWPRINIPEHLEGDTPSKREARVPLIKQTLKPLIAYLGFGSDVQIVTLRHDVIRDLVEAIGELRDEMTGTQSNSRIYRVGDKVTFSKNYYPPREQLLPKDAEKRRQVIASVEYRLRTTQINNNEISVIKEIVDIEPNTGVETKVNDTIQEKPSLLHQRVIRFLDGGQVNLCTITVGNIYPGIVSTISSMQGSQAKRVVAWLDRRDVHVFNEQYGPLVKRDTIYTVHSRAERQVILICNADYNSIPHTDVGTAIKYVRSPPDLTVHNWLPPYEGPPLEELLARLPKQRATRLDAEDEAEALSDSSDEESLD